MRVWSRDWWLNKDRVINNIVKAINANKKKFESDKSVLKKVNETKSVAETKTVASPKTSAVKSNKKK